MASDKAFWAEFKPINPATGLTVRVRICTLNTADATGIDLGNGEWLPYMSSFPDTEISVFDGQFDGMGQCTLDNLQADDISQFALMFPSYIWDGTDVTVYRGSESTTTLGALTKIFSGSVTETPSNEDSTVKWVVRDKSYLFDTEILKTTYAGTTGYEGTAEMKGVSKPFTLGEALNLEPVLVDPAYLIYQYHGYGTTIGVQGLYENGLGFGAGQTAVAWAGSTAATFAALRAKVLTAGQWCDCPSIGMFRLGGEPVSGGVISCDVKGHAVGGVLVERIDEAIDLLIDQAPATVGALVDGSSYTGLYTGSANQTVADYWTGPVNLGEVMAKYLSDCGAYHFINTAGLLRFGFVRMGTPALEIRTDGTSYPIPENTTVQPVSAPYKRIRMGADRVFRVHSLDEISDALYQAVYQLQTELTDLTNDFYLAVDDDNLTIQEKIQTAIPTNTYYGNQYIELRARALVLGLSVTTLDAAYNAYISDRNAISPAWNDTSQNSTGIPATFRANVAGLGAALVAISVDISEEDAKRANWGTVVGTGKPSDNAGTSNLLTVIGSFSTSVGNTVTKAGGTHGTFEGGVVGVKQKGTAFITSSCLFDNTGGGGWHTHLYLDATDATGYTGGSTNGNWYARYTSSNTSNGTLALYKRSGGSYSLVNSWTIAGVTTDARRFGIFCNGRRVFATCDGVQYGGDTSAYDVVSGVIDFWPKVLDYFNSVSTPTGGIRDIQYGPFDDARTLLDDGYTIINQSGFKTDEGTAAAIAGQGALATQNSADWRSQVYARPAVADLYYDFNYASIAEMQAAGWTFPSGTAQFSLTNNANSPGGKALVMGNGSTTGNINLFGPEWVPYNSGDMYEIAIDLEVISSHASALIYVGVEAQDRAGNTLGNSHNYVVFQGQGQNALVGQRVIKKGYLTGFTSLSGSGQSNDPLAPAALPDGTAGGFGQGGAVKFRPMVLSNYNALTGQAKIHAIRVTRIPARIAAKDEIVFGEITIKETAGGSTATLTNFKTLLGTANAIVSQGSLATKNSVDLSSSDVVTKGSIPPMVANSGLAYTSTTGSISFSWSSFSIYRPDTSVLTVASGSQSYTGLPSAFSFRFYAYATDPGGVVGWPAGYVNSYAGTPAIGYTSGSYEAATQMCLQGRVPLGPFSASTTGSGSGGGSGGGSNCIHEDLIVGDKRAGDLRKGDFVPTCNGEAEVRDVMHYTTSRWFELYSGDEMVSKTTGEHQFYRAVDGMPVKAQDIKLGEILKSNGDHVEITGMRLGTDVAKAVGILIEDPHLHLMGPKSLLTHNGNQKP